MENKYYVDEDGLIVVIQSISDSIIKHTSGEIKFNETVNPDTGETEKVLEKPNNFPTVKAVTDYLENRKKLKIVQESMNNNQEVVENRKEYNGEEEVHVDMKLITSDDIKKLFR